MHHRYHCRVKVDVRVVRTLTRETEWFTYKGSLVGDSYYISIVQCPEGGAAVKGPGCKKDKTPMCSSCAEGYHLVKEKKLCDANMCKCENGIPTQGSQCPVPGEKRCRSCKQGYYLSEGACFKANQPWLNLRVRYSGPSPQGRGWRYQKWYAEFQRGGRLLTLTEAKGYLVYHQMKEDKKEVSVAQFS